MLRDLGSSNGTYVNGKRVTGEQSLKHGDELTVGAVTLRVAKLGQPASPLPASPAFKPKAGDTAVVDAVEVDGSDLSDDEEFEMEFDDGEPVPEVEGIPLADDAVRRDRPAQGRRQEHLDRTNPPSRSKRSRNPRKPAKGGEDDAVADFLLELDLDDDD